MTTIPPEGQQPQQQPPEVPQPPSAAPSDRSNRTCDRCGVNDVHAHHVQYAGAVEHPITKEMLDMSVTKHIQCCAADGCQICTTDLEFAAQAGIPDHQSPSDAFNHYMQNKTPEHHQALFQRHGVETASFTRQEDPAVSAAHDELLAAGQRFNQAIGAPAPEGV